MMNPHELNLKVSKVTDFVFFASLAKDLKYPGLGVGCSEEEYSLMYSLVQELKPKKILELGSGFGTSGKIFLMADKDVQLTQVDMKDQEEAQYFIDVESRKRITYCKMKTTAFFPSDERFDIVFVDADHTEAAVKKDLENARSVLTSHGVILAHDTCHDQTEYISKLAQECAEACGKRYYELKTSKGLGVIY